MNFNIENVEFYLVLLVRISAFMFSAPFFSMSNVPVKVKVGLAFFITIFVYSMIGYQPLHYVGMIGFSMLLIKEAIVGLLIGYMANISTFILGFTGQFIDMEIGFSMVNVLDPVSKVQTTITGNFYSYMVMLMLLATNMHYFVLRAIVDSFRLIPVERAILSKNLYEIMVRFLGEYFVIGFRIALPIFSCILIINVVLGILAKVAPQMNIFVIGMQLKIIVGLFILFIMVGTIPVISDFVFDEMEKMTSLIIEAMKP